MGLQPHFAQGPTMSFSGFIWRRFFSPVYRHIKTGSSIDIGKGLVAYGIPVLDLHRRATLSIGENVVLCSKSGYTALGVSKPCILRTIAPGASIAIGNDCGLSGTVIVSAAKITLGRECLIGADVLICDTDFHPIEPERRRFTIEGTRSGRVAIGNNVFIGTRSTILKGANIGDNSVIGAGSVVVGNIPANVIAAGNPAKVLRQI
jgi:acetyltransferase-like isoleucine patch superfamily enzyme